MSLQIECSDATRTDEMFTRVMSLLSSIEQRFSTYIAGSEVSRYGRGELALDEISDDMTEVLSLCESVKRASNGAFDAHAAAQRGPSLLHQHPEHAIEPSGVVKGWAIDRAARLLWESGFHDFCLNVGGDMVASGAPASDERGWRVGIRHPVDHENVMAIVQLRDRALATSGLYERGQHIVGVGPDNDLTSLSVIGHDIALVDAYATAAFVMGRSGIAWLASMSGFGVIAADGQTTHFSQEAREVVVVPTAVR